MLSLKRLLTANGLKSQLPILGELTCVQRRHNQTTYPHTLTYGEGGRNSYNGNVVTVFGATGVLGRYVISQLAKTGTQIVVPFRSSEDDVRDLRVCGDLGQIVFLEYSVRDYESILKTMTHSNAAINLVGKNFETRHFSYKDALVDAASSIASAAAECGVNNLIHVSHLLADEASPSVFMQMKAAGEKAVLEKFPGATIMRPSDAFGDEDKYLNRFAYMRKLPRFPLVGSGYDVMKLPVYIQDIAQGIRRAAHDPTTAGNVYEVYGPEEYHLREIVEFVFRMIREDLKVVNIPQKWYENIGYALEQSFFEARHTKELVVRENLNEVATPGALTLADLGVTPTNLNDVAITILRRHRPAAYEEQMWRDEDAIRPSHVIEKLLAEQKEQAAAAKGNDILSKVKGMLPQGS